MRKIMLFLITVLALTTVATAFESGAPYIGCPKHMPGCPGYDAKYEMTISSKGPTTITGNPRGEQGRWPQRRSYAESCYWAAEGGLTCMQAGTLPKYQPKRFRREEMIEMQSDTVERQTVPRQPVKISDSGFTGMSGRLGGRFGWRGYAPRLRDVYGPETQ